MDHSGNADSTCSVPDCGVSRGDATIDTRNRPLKSPSSTRPCGSTVQTMRCWAIVISYAANASR